MGSLKQGAMVWTSGAPRQATAWEVCRLVPGAAPDSLANTRVLPAESISRSLGGYGVVSTADLTPPISRRPSFCENSEERGDEPPCPVGWIERVASKSPLRKPRRFSDSNLLDNQREDSRCDFTMVQSDVDAITLLTRATGPSPTSPSGLMKRLETASRRLFSRNSMPIRLVNAEVRLPISLRDGSKCALIVRENSSLGDVLDSYARATGAGRHTAEVHVIERPVAPTDGGVTQTLYNIANGVRHPRRIMWSFQDAASWFLLPPVLAREARGRGLLAWAHEHVTPHLRLATSRLRISQVDVRDEVNAPLMASADRITVRGRVHLQNGRRVVLSLNELDTIRTLHETVSMHAAVPKDRQVVVLREGRSRGSIEVAVLAFLSAALALIFSLIDTTLRMVGILDPNGLRRLTLSVRTQSGRSVTLNVRCDATLQELMNATHAATGELVDHNSLLLISENQQHLGIVSEPVPTNPVSHVDSLKCEQARPTS